MRNLFNKKGSITILLFALTAMVANATTITVDNNAGSAAQYTDLQTAVDAVQAGDTILVAGSVTSYGSITLKKKVILLGAGYAGLSSKMGQLVFQNLTSVDGSSDSFVSGFQMSSISFTVEYTNRTSATYASLSGIIIERCIVSGINFHNNYAHFSNITVRNNAFNITGFAALTSNNISTYSSILFSNNIIDGGYFGSRVVVSSSNGVEFVSSYQSTSGVAIRNNIFVGPSSRAFSLMIGATVENNIFYNRNLITEAEYNSFDSLAYGLNFNNNITYLTGQDLTLNSWYAVGANNQSIDPQYENFPIDGAAFSTDHNYRLKTGSPAIGAGVNGEDLGIYGGAYPWPGDLVIFPKGPRVIELKPVGSPSVPAGSTLDVQFKSVINN